jgi:large repetitive protein
MRGNKMIGYLLFLFGCEEEIKGPITEEEEGNILVDEDGDTFFSDEDCDDSNPLIYPNADEICDGIDNNCNDLIDEDVMTTYYQDFDEDGFGDSTKTEESCSTPDGYSLTGTDCDDNEPLSFPGSIETCDNIDNNCDGEIDEGVGILFFGDMDGDGYGDEETPILSCEIKMGLAEVFGDCDDSNSTVYPEAPELCDNLDNDCDADIDEDATSTFYADIDNDGFGDPETATELCSLTEGFVGNNLDCNDIDTNISPLIPEICDEVDNNCDGNIDEGVLEMFYADQDSDTYGDAANPIESCSVPEGYVSNDLDCSDSNAFAWTELGIEICDGEDNDCDEEVDEDDSQNSVLWYEDSDGDNFGNPDSSVWSCAAPDGFVSNSEDCDDEDITSSPIGIEFCDNVDNNCDGEIDEGSVDAEPWYEDGDEDGFGEIVEDFVVTLACEAPIGFVGITGDCNDNNDTIHPEIEEICDGIDNNCDEEVDNEAVDMLVYFVDEDGDGFGSEEVVACVLSGNLVAIGDDCDDASDQISPDGVEMCDGIDNDCDEEIDEEAVDAVPWYEDGDEDGFGEIVEEGLEVFSCEAPVGFVELTGDCNDNNDSIGPEIEEVCNAKDDNCDGEIDEDGIASAPVWYQDLDQDEFGDDDFPLNSCSDPEGYVSNNLDCDDLDNDVYPNATEFCNEEDDDCDEEIDEVGAIGRQAFYLDDDGDGYGTVDTSIEGCSAPDNYVLNDNDCDDGDALTYLGAPEVCSSGDRNCDGVEEDLCGSCLELLDVGMGTESGVYTIQSSSASGSQDVYCDMETDGGGWTQFAFLGVDTEGYDYRYSAIFSDVGLGEVGSGSFKVDASEMVISASELRYSEPLSSEEGTVSTVDDWEYDISCDMTPQVLSKILSPGYMNQPAASITCTDLHTGFLSPNAILANYQSWSGCWSENRFWIGSDEQASNNYHGNYCADCVVTWKCNNNSIAGVYAGPSAGYYKSVAFWLR